ncbi:MAG: aminotransferase class I/II-fold pyridoxal phosphate-dependent enzyme [Alphaproteobacteria bacterium]|nr:aminotransferase class I/II-fold pyridoxal phosphate-dependent enzyme [Alphaproteobacteria bacterium]
MTNHRLDPLKDYAFRQLRELLTPIQPRSNRAPILLSVGEPQNQPPAFIAEEMAKNADKWNRYTDHAGTPEFRKAVAAWLTRRYRLPSGMVNPEKHVLPVPGSREGLFMAALFAVPETKAGKKPAALIPNPSYHVYTGAAIIAGADLVYLPARKETGFLPDLDAVATADLDRAAIFYLCTPANPQGAVAGLDYLKRAVELARRHDFLLVVDECYAEIYDKTPPPGALEACAALGGSMDHVVIAHSLSKRSSAPGLRSGFVAGALESIQAFVNVLNYGAAGMSQPILAAATRLWSDEAHVDSNREIYRRNFDIADKVLGGRFGYYRPAGGFYLWLDVGDGAEAAKKLWGEAGIRVLPGGFMSWPDRTGKNHGQPYIRVAMVYDEPMMETALKLMTQVL